MALTAKREYNTVGHSDMLSVAAVGDDTYYKGAMLVLDAAGYANVPSDAAGLVPAGVFTGRSAGGGTGDSVAVASGSHTRLEIERGRIWIPFSGAAQSDVGELFYLSDDGTLTQSAGSKDHAVQCVDFRSGYVLIDFRTAAAV
jgi:hypothetical protein